MSEYIPDYTDLHAEYEAEQERRLRRHPKCDCCVEKITTEKFFNVEGTYICLVCIEDFKVDTDDYMED